MPIDHARSSVRLTRDVTFRA